MIGWKVSNGDEMLITADDLIALHLEIRRLRGGNDTGFEYVMGGATCKCDVSSWRDLIKSMPTAGATWWLEYTGVSRPLDESRAAVAADPMQVD